MLFKLSRILKYLVLLFGCLVLYAIFIEPYWIQVQEIEIPDEPFATFFKSNKTIFMSDIHVTRFGLREKLLLDKISQISPEIILLGGDLVGWNGDYQSAFEFLGKLKAPKGVYGVLGESDFQDNRKSCNFCHTFGKSSNSFSAKFLQNQVARLPDNQTAIFGLDMRSLDPELRKRSGVETLMEAAIIISHRQGDVEGAPDLPVLLLSGDTHGGQVWMPNWLWNWTFGKSKGPIRKGIGRSGKKISVVTSGIGVNRIPLRFLCPPEVLILKGR